MSKVTSIDSLSKIDNYGNSVRGSSSNTEEVALAGEHKFGAFNFSL